MLAFFRDGFYKDFFILVLITVMVGTIFSSGIAWAVDSYFGDTIDEMIGEHGEYDVMLHIREEARDAAFRELERISAEQFPGASINETLTIAGQSNFFFGLPEEFKKREVMESLSTLFSGLPGLNGYTVILEPSILIRGVHASVRTELRNKVEQISGVRFAFRDRANMIVYLESNDYSREVSEQVKRLLAEYQIVELRFPMGFEVNTQEVGEQTIRVLETRSDAQKIRNITSAESSEDLDAFLKTLVEMRDFLFSYASKVKIKTVPGSHVVVGEQIIIQGIDGTPIVPGSKEADDNVVIEIVEVFGDEVSGMIIRGSISQATELLTQEGYRLRSNGEIQENIGVVELENERYRLAYTINESLRLLNELEELSVQADLAIGNADAVLNTFQEALMQLEVLQIQIRQLNEGLASGGTQGAGEQLLMSLLINGLLKSLTQAVGQTGEASIDSLENLDIEAMRSSLNSISDQIGNVQEIDVAAIIEQIEYVRDSLPQLEDEEIGKSIRLINTYIAGQVIPGERVQILVQGGNIDEKKVEPDLRTALKNPYLNTYSMSVGMVNPDARSELIRLLKEVRAIIAGMLAIVFTVATLVLDHATIFSTIKFIKQNKRAPKHRIWRIIDPTKWVGSIFIAGMLMAIYSLSGAAIPMLNVGAMGIVGFLLGFAAYLLAERFSPVHVSEIMAGQALGLSNVQIMREIVIPASRPGLMNVINRWKQRF